MNKKASEAALACMRTFEELGMIGLCAYMDPDSENGEDDVGLETLASAMDLEEVEILLAMWITDYLQTTGFGLPVCTEFLNDLVMDVLYHMMDPAEREALLDRMGALCSYLEGPPEPPQFRVLDGGNNKGNTRNTKGNTKGKGKGTKAKKGDGPLKPGDGPYKPK